MIPDEAVEASLRAAVRLPLHGEDGEQSGYIEIPYALLRNAITPIRVFGMDMHVVLDAGQESIEATK